MLVDEAKEFEADVKALKMWKDKSEFEQRPLPDVPRGGNNDRTPRDTTVTVDGEQKALFETLLRKLAPLKNDPAQILGVIADKKINSTSS